jgi:hypothetical protein
MRGLIFWVFPLLAILNLAACAHGEIERRIDERLSRIDSVNTPEELQLKTAQLINLTPGLTRTQRWELAALQDSTRTKIEVVQKKALNLRVLLIEELVSVQFDPQEVDAIKRRIVATDKERLDITFNALELASSVLGHDPVPHRQRIMDWLLDPTVHHKDNP